MGGDTLSPRMARFESGALLEGKYEIDRVIGSGGMGDVYLVRHSILGQRFALKVLNQSGIGEEERRRFLAEAKITAQFENDHIVKTIDFGVLPDGSLFSVMEFLEGEDLAARLVRKSRLPIEEAANYVLQACIGLASAHREGVVHRDLKPANLFLARKQGGATTLKILDFGVAKTHSMNESLTSNHAVFGTPTHMSPEQLRSSKHVDARADLWAIGVILYQLVTGELPFDAEAPALYFVQILNNEPRPMGMFGIRNSEFEALVLQLLKKDPNERIPDVATLAEALAPFASVGALALSGEVAAVMEGSRDSAALAIGKYDRREQTTGVAPDTQDNIVTDVVQEGGAGRTKRILIALGIVTSLMMLAIVTMLILRRRSEPNASVAEPLPATVATATPRPSGALEPSDPRALAKQPEVSSSGTVVPPTSAARLLPTAPPERNPPRRNVGVPASGTTPKIRQTDHL